MISLGDLAQSFMLRRHNATTRQDISRLAEEVATGRTSDVAARLSGSFSYLADIERNLGRLQGYRTSTSEAGTFAAGMQAALGRVQDIGSDLSTRLIESASSGIATVTAAAARDAVDSLDRIVSALNTQIGGRSLFAGNATATAPLVSAEVLRAEMLATVAGQTTADGVQAALDTWFDAASGGFQSLAYTGANSGLDPFHLGPHETVDLDLTAGAPEIRSILKQVGLAAIAADQSLPLSPDVRADLMRRSAEGLIAVQDDLTGLRADLGFAEARIEDSKVRQEAEASSLEIARNALLGVDPFDVATRLTDAQQRLESLYAVTARLSRLTLSDFLR
jgi:flagellar hook-associated protein 3 FlgL